MTGRPCAHCGRTDTRPYMNAPLCPDHAPPAVPTPDPTRTLAALRARKEPRP
ncbi:hypothetical protein GCM10007967_09940 [Xylanimonas ulmi]|uniref:Uncharacterized protein n=1 Tax=Xylanimonas ulmi TaxID=228973 RepID=A0A4Q7M1G6_9MICO|nr:hypothetical protein EV386_1975 [Xylanibacterium ulmi]